MSFRKGLALLGAAALLPCLALFGCGGGSSSHNPNQGVTGTYRNVGLISSTGTRATCPGSATNANTTFSCGATDDLTLNADGTYVMTGVDSGALGGHGTYELSSSTLIFTPTGSGTSVAVNMANVGNNTFNFKFSNGTFQDITLVYQKQ